MQFYVGANADETASILWAADSGDLGDMLDAMFASGYESETIAFSREAW